MLGGGGREWGTDQGAEMLEGWDVGEQEGVGIKVNTC